MKRSAITIQATTENVTKPEYQEKKIKMNAKRIITAIFLLALVCALTIIAPMGAFAEESAPKVSIERFNLSFNENIYIKYAVSFEGVDPSKLNKGDVGMLFWTSPQERYEKDNAESISTDITYDSGVKYYIFA